MLRQSGYLLFFFNTLLTDCLNLLQRAIIGEGNKKLTSIDWLANIFHDINNNIQVYCPYGI
jgi:hypothetical protein